MRKFLFFTAFGLIFSLALSGQLFAKNYTFGEKQGEPIPTQYDIEERRINLLTEKMDEVSARVDNLNKTQAQTNEYLAQLLAATNIEQQQLQKLIIIMQGSTQDQEESKKTGADPQVLALSELMRLTKEQNETLKLLVTLIYQVNNEQKTTNSLLGAAGEKAR